MKKAANIFIELMFVTMGLFWAWVAGALQVLMAYKQ